MNSKFPNVGTSIFSEMSKMASENNAVNLSQGFPDFPIDTKLTEIVAKVAKGNFNQYMPASGYPPLLQKIGNLISKTYGRNLNPETEILITAGATQGIFTAIQAFVHSGDDVIILDPAYDCYDAPIVLCGAKLVHVSLKDDFSPDWNAIRNAVNERTRMIVINNPHNPSGRIWANEDFMQLEKMVEKYPEILILSDEVYEFITFEKPHISIHSWGKLREKSIVISSFGKSFHVTGWKIGYVTASESILSEIKKIHQYLVFSVNSIAQAAINDYLDVADIPNLGSFYQQKRDLFRSLLQQSRFELLPSEGTYFQVASYKNISDENDVLFAKRLVSDYGVAAIPLSVFSAEKKDLKLIRFCFAKENTTIESAVKRLLTV